MNKKVITCLGIHLEMNYSDQRTLDVVLKEMNKDAYKLQEIEFNENDVVLDLGANIGIVSLYLAKKYPFLHIYGYEASPENFALFSQNIKNNNLENHTNLKIFNLAVSKNNKDVFIIDGINGCGNKSISHSIKTDTKIGSITLDEIFIKNNIESIKLLKIDVEGAEFDILYASRKLKQIEYISAEFHGGYIRDKLLSRYLSKYIIKEKIFLDQDFWSDHFAPFVFILNRFLARIKRCL